MTGREPSACSSGSELLRASSEVDNCISSVGKDMYGSKFGADDYLSSPRTFGFFYTLCLVDLLYENEVQIALLQLLSYTFFLCQSVMA